MYHSLHHAPSADSTTKTNKSNGGHCAPESLNMVTKLHLFFSFLISSLEQRASGRTTARHAAAEFPLSLRWRLTGPTLTAQDLGGAQEERRGQMN